ncbi:MAG: efflux RND transporter permease subunit, partial [Bacteroidota bacterium]
MLYFTFHSVIQSLLIYSAVPMSAIGGVFALWTRGMNFSISAGVGFIALFGVAVLNVIVLISEFNRLEKEGISDITERVRKGLKTRLSPVLMTAMVASLGFLPMALSTSAGAEVQKPLATGVIGGLITATFLTLFVLPVFYILVTPKKNRYSSREKKSKLPLFILLLLPGFLVVNKSNAQQAKTINLKQAIQMALDSNLAVRSSVYSVDVQKALKGASWDIPKTTVNGEYGQFNSYNRDNGFSVSQSFAFPTVYVNQNKLAKANIKSSELQLQASQLGIATLVKQVYWQLAYLKSKQKLFAYQDSLYLGFLRAAELRASIGETNRLEMITARSQSLEVRNQLQQIRADLVIYNQKLQSILNIETPLYPADTVLHRADFLQIADSSSLEANPSVGFMRQQVDISHVEMQLARSQMMPEFILGYSSQTLIGSQDINGIPRYFGPGNRFNGIQAGISLPLWFAPYTSKTQAAKLKEDVARTNAKYYSKLLSGNFRSFMGEFTKYQNSIEYYEKQAIPEANMIIEQATRSYKAGAMDYLDYILSLSRALGIKLN